MTPGAEGDLELLAEEQVLDHETLTATGGSNEGGHDEPDEFEHRSRIVDQQSPQIVVRTFAALHAFDRSENGVISL